MKQDCETRLLWRNRVQNRRLTSLERLKMSGSQFLCVSTKRLATFDRIFGVIRNVTF